MLWLIMCKMYKYFLQLPLRPLVFLSKRCLQGSQIGSAELLWFAPSFVENVWIFRRFFSLKICHFYDEKLGNQSLLDFCHWSRKCFVFQHDILSQSKPQMRRRVKAFETFFNFRCNSFKYIFNKFCFFNYCVKTSNALIKFKLF